MPVQFVWHVLCGTDGWVTETSDAQPTLCPVNSQHSVINVRRGYLAPGATNTVLTHDGYQKVPVTMMATMPSNTIRMNNTQSASDPIDVAITTGDLITHDGTTISILPIGTTDKILISNGTTFSWATNPIDAHLVDTANPHSVTKAQVGLSNVENLKVNLAAVTPPTVTDDSGSDYAVGSRWIDVTNDKSYTCVDSTVGSAVWKETSEVILNKYDGTVAPAVTDDSNSGYVVGSTWIDVLADFIYICVDQTAGSAVWKLMEDTQVTDLTYGNFSLSATYGSSGAGTPVDTWTADVSNSITTDGTNISGFKSGRRYLISYAIRIDGVSGNHCEYKAYNNGVTEIAGSSIFCHSLDNGTGDGDASGVTFIYLAPDANSIQIKSIDQAIGAEVQGTHLSVVELSTNISGTVGITNNFGGTTAPAATDDNADDYSIGSTWVDITNDKSYVCVDAALGAAVWIETTEVNTASNVGSGTGLVFKQKTGVDFEFKTVATGSTKLSVTDGTDDVTLDVVEANIVHQNISGAGTNTHAEIDTHIANTSNPHSVTKAQVGLADVEDLKVNLAAVTPPTVTDDSGSDYSVGSSWIDVTNDKSYTCVDSTVGSAVWKETSEVILNKYDGTVAPAVTDDSNSGYVVGSTWIDVLADFIYICVDQTAGSAVWKLMEDTQITDLTYGNFSLSANYTSSGAGDSVDTWTADVSNSITTDGTNISGFKSGRRYLISYSIRIDTLTYSKQVEFKAYNDGVTEIAGSSIFCLSQNYNSGDGSVPGVTFVYLAPDTNGIQIKSIGEGIGAEVQGTHLSVVELSTNISGTVGITNNFGGTTAPATTDDNADDYSIGSTWVDITNDKSYVCVDAALGAAVWIETTEVNTASNVGSGTGLVFKQKTGVDFEFKTVATGSTKLSVTDGTDDVTLDVVEANIVHQNISGAGTNTHAEIDTHIANTSNPHSVTKAQVGLADVEDLKVNLVAAAPPATTDDTGSGYSVGSRWFDVTNDKEYVCMDSTASAAVWVETTEVNTVSNVGSGAGIVFKQKTGVDFEFKTVATGSTKLSVTNGTDDVTLDVVEANIVHQNISGAGTNTHAQIDTHIASVANPHSVTGAQVSTVHSATNYTAGTGFVDGHLSGIDTALAGLVSGMHFKGEWDVSATTDFPGSGSAITGDFYVVAGAPTGVTLGSSNTITVNTNDKLVANTDNASVSDGSNWVKVDDTDSVQSVSGKTGSVTLVKADVGLGNVENLKVNLVAAAPPATTDDTGSGYSVGSRWFDITNDKEYVCMDTTVSAAVWVETTEVNTVSNVGTDGVGVFKQKNGVDFEFKNVHAGSSRVVITDDTANDEIDIDVVHEFHLVYDGNKTSGTVGGSSVSGSWNVRQLNTHYNPSSSANVSIATNQITLQSGTWNMRAQAPGTGCEKHRIQLYNVTGSAIVFNGANAYARNDEPTSKEQTTAHFVYEFTIGSATVYEIRHYTQLNSGTDTLGVPVSASVNEIYAMVELVKID
jgi:predicted secreted protein